MTDVNTIVDLDGTVGVDGCNYLSLSAAVADDFNLTSQDLVTNTENAICTLKYTGTTQYDTTAVNLDTSGYTTSSSYRVKIVVDAGSRHDGTPDSGYCLKVAGAYNVAVLQVGTSYKYVDIEGLEIWNTRKSRMGLNPYCGG